MDQFCQCGDVFGLAVKRIPDQPPQVFSGERLKDDFVHDGARLANRFELADQRMGGIDLVIPVSPDQHQMLHVRLGQQILQQVERCRVEPLQIVEEQRQRVLRPGEHSEKAPENQLKAALRVTGRQLRDRRLVADDELQLRNQVYDKPPVRAQRFAKSLAPSSQLWIALAKQRSDQALKGLRQGRIRDVTLVL